MKLFSTTILLKFYLEIEKKTTSKLKETAFKSC